ncbi:hypothetical protein E2C01_066437 [Portunus trituberculatus]|uniref:Uncharacterized protein n=1 Tax=Portunus trituberculatus TaxID=210409 RepID=A0A5B7HPS0_PORTR|nr:hypothetical protein [Portunus trituberculatus]
MVTLQFLSIPTALLGQEGSRADHGEVARQGERTSITSMRETAGFFRQAVNCGIIMYTYVRRNSSKF